MFQEFKEVLPEEWEAKIKAELKGADYNKILVSEFEDLNLKPFYTKEDVKGVSVNTPKNSWKKLTTNPELMEYADFLWISKEDDLSVSEHKTLMECKEFHVSSNKNCQYLYDLLGVLESTGNWPEQNKEKSFEPLTQKDSEENQKILIDGSLYQNAGASFATQLALMLLKTNEYVHELGIECLKKTVFKTAIGSNYLLEVAKLRALRLLFNNLAKEYNIEFNISIIAETSERNKSTLDKENNLIRSMLEASAAIQGGTDFLLIHSYQKEKTLFSEELANKQQILLEQESHFGVFNNPIDGSYSLESITIELAEKALNLFKEFEQKGGFISCLENGEIQNLIEAQNQKEKQAFKDGSIVLVGVNKYKTENDLIKDVSEAIDTEKTQIKLIQKSKIFE